ncbi:pyridoxal phosphate-dependent decarboxylase family protein [Rheinheimera fenheensis]|uniref:pyridoxal phosphate-dependent decarboxylase family protein n=1 Tax=Rheinheimera fenheensis TaxID=3152295 RepID=UPI00325C5598
MQPKDITQSAFDAVRRASDYAKEYVSIIHTRNVFPTQSALNALTEIDITLPKQGTPATAVLDQLHSSSASTVATTGGRYFGLVVGGSSPAAMGAAILNAAWDQIAMLESSSPAAIHYERIAAKWILQLLMLPVGCSVGFTTGTSAANITCLAAAREYQYQKIGVDIAKVGLSGAPKLNIIVSEQAHVTIHKALRILGFGDKQIQRVPCDSQGRVISAYIPNVGPNTIVCLQAGNVNSGASDRFNEIIPKLKDSGAWVHIDGAFGLWASASERQRHINYGVDLADSWAVDGHKWLNTPYDCGLAICRHPKAVHSVMTTGAPYLTRDASISPKDVVPEFSRRARGIEVWAAIKEMGQIGIEDLVNRCCEHAQSLANGLREIGYEILNEVSLNQVVATIGSVEQLRKIHAFVQKSGECWFGLTVWNGRDAFRLSVSSWATTSKDIERTLAAIKYFTNQVLSASPTE